MEIYKATGDSPGKLMFTAPDSGGGYEEVIRIEHGKFYWKGEEVEDAHNVYERFNNWLKIVEANTTTHRDEVIEKLRGMDVDDVLAKDVWNEYCKAHIDGENVQNKKWRKKRDELIKELSE